MNYSTLKKFFYSGGLLFLCLCCFFVPLSSSFMSISFAGLVLCWFFSGEVKKLPNIIQENKSTWFPLLLFAILFLGVFYSSASWEESLMILKKYRELLYFPIILSFLHTERKRQPKTNPSRYAKCALFAGMVVLMLLSYSMYFGWIPIAKFGYSTIHHITHSFFMAILAFWALQNSLVLKERDKKWYRVVFFSVFLLAMANLFFIAFGRSGMVIFAILLVLTILQKLRIHQTILSLLLVCGLLIGIYFTSQNFSARVDATINEVVHYQPGVSRSSLGMRFDWWHNSIQLIEKSPLIGYGTGSFATEQQKIITDKKTQPSDNPHNEYLLLGVQLGLPGIFVFLALLIHFFRISYILPQKEKNILQGVVLAFAWGCLANSWLLDSHPGHFFMVITAILISNEQKK